MTLPTIGMFWDGPPLGFIERLCLTSFVHVGHPVVLFSYGKVEGAPDGVELAPASDVLPKPSNVVKHKRTGSPAIYADKFRYHLLSQNAGMIWSDTDAYCHKPFLPKNGYFFARETNNIVANGVMALPSESRTLQSLIDFCEDEYAIPPWMMPKHIAEMEERNAANDPMHVSEMPWGAWGPKALSHFLKQHGEFEHALDPHVLYPVPFENRRLYFREAWETWERVKEDTVSIHFYGRRVRNRLHNRFKGTPPAHSVLAELATKHSVDF